MTIDTSGKWWKGSEAEDLEEYLHALSAQSYPTTEFRLSKCGCDSVQFILEYAPAEGVARRICVVCFKNHFICGSEEYWSQDLKPKKYKCITCKSKVANLGVGFALCKDRTAVHWLYVGSRCAKCGVLGSCVDWKVGHEPSLELLSEA